MAHRKIFISCATLFCIAIFKANDAIGQSCDERRTITSGETATLTSPNYPDEYPINSDCTYKLKSESPNEHVTITFDVFSLESHRLCSFDYLDVFDGPSTSSTKLGRLCGSVSYSFTSSANYLTLHFHSDGSEQGKGFSFTYRSDCTFSKTEARGEFSSPGYPSNYPSNSQCTYNIEPLAGNQLLLTFNDFRIEHSSDCSFDYLEIFTGAVSIGRYCGSKLTYRRLFNSSRLRAQFHSDHSINRPGFDIEYQVISNCEGSNNPCDQLCLYSFENGIVVCSCNTGYKINDDGVSCSDVDECASSPCDGECANTLGSFVCSCPRDGFLLAPDNRTCTDMTCKINNGGCEHICRTFGDSQYNCICHPGYVLKTDGHNCTDIDECNSTRDNYQNKCHHNCVNEPGSYYCTCNDGYQLSSNGRECLDIDECPSNEHECSQLCENVAGGWKCSCFPGYEVDNSDLTECVDIDECSRGTFPKTCLTCTNHEGSYECTCKDGYEPNEDNTNCTDVNECGSNNGYCHQICINQPGSFTCDCERGYTDVDGTCVDTNECESNDGRGPCSHYCENNPPGSFSCFCNRGFNLIEDNLSCEDINECDTNNGGCQQQCTNSDGSFSCSCFLGYSDVNGNCTDVDECLQSPCDPDVPSTCSNTIGSFTCACPPGYRVNNTQCLDIDECVENLHGCQQQCVNLNGSFSCECYPGYVKAPPDDTCVDINECEDATICDQVCENTIGSYRCDCNDGFYLLGNQKGCSDVDECAEGLSDCNQICINQIGYHYCDCNPGYGLGRDNATCSDIDECNDGTNECSDHCLNIAGHYICYCHNGFQLMADNHTCQDINECDNNNGGCAHICNNNNGSYSCGCQDGYIFNGTHSCRDINECVLNNGNCMHDCINYQGSYECQCKPNFKLSEDNHNCTHCPTCDQFQQVQRDVDMLKHLSRGVDLLTNHNAELRALVYALTERIERLENH